MPEYLAPGVYVEETSFRSKSIEGVSTSTAGFVGPTRWGPLSGQPELITSLADFERIYGGLDDLNFIDQGQTTNYLAHGVRAFFEEGGKRLYVTRVFSFGDGVFTPPLVDGLPKGKSDTDKGSGYARTASNQDGQSTTSPPPTPPPTPPPSPSTRPITLLARFPGEAGNMQLTFALKVGNNILTGANNVFSLTQIRSNTVVYVGTLKVSTDPNGRKRIDGWTPSPKSNPADGLLLAVWNAEKQTWELHGNGDPIQLSDLGATPTNQVQVRPVTVVVSVAYPTVNVQGARTFGPQMTLGEFGFDPRNADALNRTFTRRPATRLDFLTSPISLEIQPQGGETDPFNPPDQNKKDQFPLDFARELLGATVIGSLSKFTNPPDDTRRVYTLRGGNDGVTPGNRNYEGLELEFLDFLDDPLHPIQSPKNGLLAFEAVDDISIVAAPGYSAYPEQTPNQSFAIEGAVINHCEKMRYRIAVLDTPPKQLVSGAQDFRSLRSSKYAALYYPWITIANPLRDERLNLPPSGFVAGIYARNDTEHAVFKAPANEVVRLAVDFEQRINKAQQDVLNPQGINCFRFFPDRGFLLWGARTISDDSEWKYVSIRRYFAYLEHSIDKGTQWVVFENNGPQTWTNVRHTIEDFLLNEWKMGGLLGNKPEEAYFVRCDLSTMTQNDLDNGRLVCLIGVAVVKPAEFVIFRIGQWTAQTKS